MPEIQTTVECCDAMHSTPFCPLCGKGLALDVPLVALLNHITGQASRLKLKAFAANHRPDDHGKYAEAAAKWESWRVALSEVISPAKEVLDDEH